MIRILIPESVGIATFSKVLKAYQMVHLMKQYEKTSLIIVYGTYLPKTNSNALEGHPMTCPAIFRSSLDSRISAYIPYVFMVMVSNIWIFYGYTIRLS